MNFLKEALRPVERHVAKDYPLVMIVRCKGSKEKKLAIGLKREKIEYEQIVTVTWLMQER